MEVLRYDVPRQDVPRCGLDVRGGRLGRCCWTVVWYVEERGKMGGGGGFEYPRVPKERSFLAFTRRAEAPKLRC